MQTSKIEISAPLTIPDHLVKEVQSKFAYVDEAISAAEVLPGGDKIVLHLRGPVDAGKQTELEEKVQRVVSSMVKGAMRPKVEILEDHLDQPVPYHQDPNPELIARGELS
jgi:hypothetical protein